MMLRSLTVIIITTFIFANMTNVFAQQQNNKQKLPSWVHKEHNNTKGKKIYKRYWDYQLKPGSYEFGFISSEADWTNSMHIGIVNRSSQKKSITVKKTFGKVDNYKLQFTPVKFKVTNKNTIIRIEAWVLKPEGYRDRSLLIRRFDKKEYIIFSAEDSEFTLDADFNDIVAYLRPLLKL